jgi:hypothetical protein
LPPFIVTLGTFTAIQAGTRLLAGSGDLPRGGRTAHLPGHVLSHRVVLDHVRCGRDALGLPRDVVRAVPNFLGQAHLRRRWQPTGVESVGHQVRAGAVLRLRRDGCDRSHRRVGCSVESRTPTRTRTRTPISRRSPRWSSARNQSVRWARRRRRNTRGAR